MLDTPYSYKRLWDQSVTGNRVAFMHEFQIVLHRWPALNSSVVCAQVLVSMPFSWEFFVVVVERSLGVHPSSRSVWELQRCTCKLVGCHVKFLVSAPAPLPTTQPPKPHVCSCAGFLVSRQEGTTATARFSLFAVSRCPTLSGAVGGPVGASRSDVLQLRNPSLMRTPGNPLPCRVHKKVL